MHSKTLYLLLLLFLVISSSRYTDYILYLALSHIATDFAIYLLKIEGAIASQIYNMTFQMTYQAVTEEVTLYIAI